MPHFHIEYSGNLEGLVDMAEICELVRATAAGIDTFPMPGIRVRATRVDHYAIADGDKTHAFLDLSIRLREGRTAEVKAKAVQTVFDALREALAPAMATHSIALSAEMRDIDGALSPKCGTIRDHLKGPK